MLVEREGEQRLRVVGLPRDDRYEGDNDLRDALIFVPPNAAVADTDATLPTVSDLGQPALSDAVSAWNAANRPREAFSFSSGGRAWLAGFEPYELGRNTFWIGVALPERDLVGALRAQRIVLFTIVGLILVFGVMRAITLARRFSSPVEALVSDTERIRKGDLEPARPIQTNVREFRRLAAAQDSMREGLKAQKKLDKIERDLDIARDIQRGLLPTELPDTPGFLIQGWSQPADQTGGDYFDWLTLPSGRTLITLADVTGHGIGPALIVAVCRAYMRAAALSEHDALTEALARVNDLLYEDMPDGRFVTAAVGLLDPGKSEMHLVSAGQAPMLFYDANAGVTENWNASEIPLGIAPGLRYGEPRRIRFAPGDVLVLTTDGFFEWADGEGQQYGIPRLETFVANHANDSPAEFIKNLHADVLNHAGGESQPDDLTVVVIKCDGVTAPAAPVETGAAMYDAD